MEKKKIFTTPIILNLIKVFLIALFFVFYLVDIFYLDGGYPLYAILVFIIISILDILNNLNLRNNFPKSTFEKILEPINSRIFRNGVLIAFTIKGVMPLFVVIILGVIDIITLVLGAYLLTKKIIFQANILGKITNVIMSISLFSCFFSMAIYPWNLILVLIGVAMVLITLIVQIVKFYKLYNLTRI